MTAFDIHFEALSEAKQLHALDQQLPYIATKAARYLEVGPDEYRKTDAFGQPTTKNADKLAAIHRGCKQLIECKGLFVEAPLTDVGVEGFYALMALFHFKMKNRTTDHSHVHDGQEGALDIITFEHAVSGLPVTFFNFCWYDS